MRSRTSGSAYALEPVGELHEVAVSVVVGPALRVHHLGSPRLSDLSSSIVRPAPVVNTRGYGSPATTVRKAGEGS